MTQPEFLACMQSRVARVAIGPSTVRGRGNAGVGHAARAYLRKLALGGFSTDDPDRFRRRLDMATDELRLGLPRTAQHWGIARKVLNIFLRDSAYTAFLRDAYGLSKTEEFLEIPLDSITAKALGTEAGRGALPRWRGVRRLTADVSAVYQEAATRAALRYGIARVHLDALWWSAGRDGGPTS